MALLLISADFAKSYIAAHTRTLPSGKVVQVAAFSDKRYKQAQRDTQTPDMFKQPLSAPTKPIPMDAAQHPEDFTPDMFTGETKKTLPSRSRREQLASEHRDKIAKEPAAEQEFRQMYNELADAKEDGASMQSRCRDARAWVSHQKTHGVISEATYDRWIELVNDIYDEKTPISLGDAQEKFAAVYNQFKDKRGAAAKQAIDEAKAEYEAIEAKRQLTGKQKATDKPNLSAVSGELVKMAREYHPTIPVGQVLSMAAKHGLHGIDDDGAPWEGMLTGRDGRTTIDLADASGKVVNAMAMQWHKMGSGKYEFNAYLTGAPMHKSARILFFKSHVKEFTRKDGTVVKEHDDKRVKKMQVAGPGRDKAAPEQSNVKPVTQAEPGSAHGFGHHNVEEGDSLKFKAGEFAGGGQVKSSGKDGAVVTDASGRDHNVHWGEVTGRGGKEPAQAPIEAKSAEPAGAEKPDYAPRNEGEADKQYAKRVVDKMDSPKSLPEDHDKYFNTEGATHVPMENLHSTKSDEENQQGGDNGPKRMQAASHGVLSKRDPITVMPHKEKAGHFEVVDGNGTHTRAKNLGWKSLPTKVVSRDEGEKQIAADKAKDAAKANAGKKKFFDPGEVEKLPHKDNVKQSAFSSWESAAKAGPGALKEYDGLLAGLGKACGFEIGKGAPDKMSEEQLSSDTPYIFMGPMKEEAKSTKKVTVDYKGDWSMLKDLVRATIAVKSIDDVHKTLAGLKEQGLEFAQKPKDNMSNGNKDGYRDLNLILKLPDSGMLVELQIAVKQISKVKGEAHHYYNENIKLDQARKEALGKLSENSVGEPKALYGDDEEKEQNWPDKADYTTFMANRKKQQEIYGGAWSKVPGIDQILKALMALGSKMILFFKGYKRGNLH